MIALLRGILIEKQPPQLILDVGGVGYEVSAPMGTFYRLPALGEEVILHTHFVVREDTQALFGFADRQERELFRTLIKVNGVGPKLALTILSGIEGPAFVRCVQQGDSASLVKLPGVGKKTAERLIIEMKDKLDNWAVLQDFELQGGAMSEDDIERSSQSVDDAVSALVSLGYKPVQASKAVAACEAPGLSSEDLIRLSLKGMV